MQSSAGAITSAEIPESGWKSMWPLHIRRSRCLLSRLDSEALMQKQESASHPDRVARAVPCLGFELAINVASNRFHEVPQGAQEGERPLGIAAAFHDQAGQMFFGFSECSFRNEKRYLFAIRLDRLAHALPQNGPHQNIGVNNQSLTWHSASSRGQPGGFPYTPSSARLHWRLRTRSSRQGLSQRPASLRVRPSGFAFVR